MIRLATTIAMAVLGIAGSALAGSITGVVEDAKTGEPIPSATVTIQGTGRQAMTDDDGRFTFGDITEPVQVTISHIGYKVERDMRIQVDGEARISLSAAVTVLNSVVVTANRYAKEAYKVSQPITAVDSREIELAGHTLVSDIIRSFPGLDMNDAGPFRARPVIRGLFGTRVLVLLDGHRLNDQRDIVDFAGISMSLVDVNEIARVEVVNGPSSVLYGSDAMGGVINIITKKNHFSPTITPIAKYSTRYSTVDQQSSNRIDLGLSSNKITFSGGFLFRDANRDFRAPDRFSKDDPRYGVYRPEFYDSLNAAQGTSFSRDRLTNSTARINNFDGRLAFRFNNRHRLDLDFGAFRGSEIGFPGVPNDSTRAFFSWPNHDRDNFSVTYTGTGLSDRLDRLSGKFYYEHISKDFLTDFLGTVVFPAGPPPNPPTGTLLNVLSHTDVKKFGLNFQEVYQMSPQAIVTFGFDAWREEIDGQAVTTTRFDGFGPAPVFDVATRASVPKNSWSAAGLYIAGEHDIAGSQINAGVRWDNFWLHADETPLYVDANDVALPVENEHFGALNGSLGIVHPLGHGVNAVGNLGTAYRVPNVVERFFFGSADGNQTRPNPDIKPERAATLDFGIKAVQPHFNYSLLGFYSGYSDFSQLQLFDIDSSGPRPVELWRFNNVEDVTIYGFEGMIEADFESGLYGSLGFTWQHGNNDTDDQPLFVSPIKTDLRVGYRDRRSSLFGQLHVRRVEAQTRVPLTTTLDDIATASFTVFDASVGFSPMQNVRLSLSGRNLFDETYSEPFNGRNPDNPVPEPGRNFVISLTTEL